MSLFLSEMNDQVHDHSFGVVYESVVMDLYFLTELLHYLFSKRTS